MDKEKTMKALAVAFTTYRESVSRALDSVGAREILTDQEKVLIKPNLVCASPHPVTTPPECCEAIIDYLRGCTKAELVLAEGTGDASCETPEIFQALGYTALARKMDVPLVDLNTEPLTRLENPDCPYFPEMYLPEIAFSHFILSVPVLKAHSLSMLTGTLKNMMGFAPPSHYAGGHGVWKKAMFHGDTHQAVRDLNTYRTPDLTVMDATLGLADYHLGGRVLDPPCNRIIAGTNAREVDCLAARFLGLDPDAVGHIR